VPNATREGDRQKRQHALAITIGLLWMIASFGACAGNPSPVPVFASRADWEILSGHWSGGYKAVPSGRHGLIDFTLSTSEEQASGDVLMISDDTHTPYRPYAPTDPRLGPVNVPRTELLTIRFVRADHGQISGTIASYWDPDRQCQATATFLGTAQPREIEGTFTSTCADGIRELRGEWRVTRQSTPRAE
jgi:hypothetical protein